MPTPVLQQEAPITRLFKVPPNYSFLRIFGYACWPSLGKYNTHKLAFRSKMCAFLGYSPMHKGYKCLDRSTRRIYISRDVVFDESVFPFATSGVTVDVSTLEHVITFRPLNRLRVIMCEITICPICVLMFPLQLLFLQSCRFRRCHVIDGRAWAWCCSRGRGQRAAFTRMSRVRGRCRRSCRGREFACRGHTAACRASVPCRSSVSACRGRAAACRGCVVCVTIATSLICLW
jgi:hypothetical protein